MEDVAALIVHELKLVAQFLELSFPPDIVKTELKSLIVPHLCPEVEVPKGESTDSSHDSTVLQAPDASADDIAPPHNPVMNKLQKLSCNNLMWRFNLSMLGLDELNRKQRLR